jgi:hypothetical protein
MSQYLEDLIYQMKPFFFLTVSVCSIANSGSSNLLLGGGVILGVAALAILKARYDHRYGNIEVNTYTYHF